MGSQYYILWFLCLQAQYIDNPNCFKEKGPQVVPPQTGSPPDGKGKGRYCGHLRLRPGIEGFRNVHSAPTKDSVYPPTPARQWDNGDFPQFFSRQEIMKG